MRINANHILFRLAAAKKNDRDKVTLYLSKSLYTDFKSICGDLPASLVIEELLKEFLESVQKKDKVKHGR